MGTRPRMGEQESTRNDCKRNNEQEAKSISIKILSYDGPGQGFGRICFDVSVSARGEGEGFPWYQRCVPLLRCGRMCRRWLAGLASARSLLGNISSLF